MNRIPKTNMINKSLYWVVTDICQLACKYCFYETGEISRMHKSIDIKKATSVVGDLAMNFDKIVFTGGEVLLYKHFWDLLQLFRPYNITLSYLSDGILLDHEIIEKSLLLGVSEISISLDSLNPTINIMQRPLKRAENSLDTSIKIIENLKMLSKYQAEGLLLTIMQSVSKINISSINSMVDFAKKLGVRLFVHPIGISVNERKFTDLRLETASHEELANLEDAMLYWADKKKNYLDYVKISIAFIRNTQLPPLFCSMGLTSYFLDMDYNLYACFHRKDICYGNILRKPVRELLQIEQPYDIKNAMCSKLGCACMLELST